jgi:hypothetical protein
VAGAQIIPEQMIRYATNETLHSTLFVGKLLVHAVPVGAMLSAKGADDARSLLRTRPAPACAAQWSCAPRRECRHGAREFAVQRGAC